MFLAVVYGGMTVILIGNVFYLRRIGRASVRASREAGRVSVLIPARNEAANLRRLLPALRDQAGLDFEVIVYDDQSDDETWQVIEAFIGECDLATGLRGKPLPSDWLGKNHALWNCTRSASGQIYVFLDADAILKDPHALTRLVERFAARPERSVLSVIPDWSVGGGGLLVSLAANSILLSIPWFLVNRLPFPIVSAMNGQCWIIRASDYHEVEPHAELRGEILEDVQIGRLLRRKGFNLWMASARRELAVRMYGSLGDAWRGLQKNAYLLFGGTPAGFLIVSTTSIVVFVIGPIVAPYFLIWQIVLKLITDRISGFSPTFAPASILSYVIGWLVSWDSFVRHLAGRVIWKGRNVAPER